MTKVFKSLLDITVELSIIRGVDKLKALEGDEDGSSSQPKPLTVHWTVPLIPFLSLQTTNGERMDMSTVSISKPEAAVAVSIKHEGEDRGHAFGPAIWLNESGKYIANVIDSEFEHLTTIDASTGEVVTDEPKYQPAWMDFREVHKMAKHFGVEVREF